VGRGGESRWSLARAVVCCGLLRCAMFSGLAEFGRTFVPSCMHRWGCGLRCSAVGRQPRSPRHRWLLRSVPIRTWSSVSSCIGDSANAHFEWTIPGFRSKL